MFDPIEKLIEFVKCPSVSTDSNFKGGMTQARDFLQKLFTEIGFEVEVVKTDLHPIVMARRGGDSSWPHVVIYGHYDVQPADPLSLWKSAPFEPVVKDGRVWGRGAADNKGPLLTHISAVASLLERRPDLPLRITFVVEGEEEVGSPSFGKFLETYKEELGEADFVLVSDTGSPSEEQVVVTCGLRGMMLLDVEVKGPKMDLHSGLHGGVLRNPIQALTELCASFHDSNGRVNVDEFYDDVVDVEPWEREELAKFGNSTDAYKTFLGIRDFYLPKGFSAFEATRFMPTLEFNGIGGGYQGEGSKTVIPSTAFVKISCRLVSSQDPERIRTLVKETIAARMPTDVEYKIIDGHNAFAYVVVPPGRSNTPPDQPKVLERAFMAIDRAVAEKFGRRPLYLREGGSIPIIADIKRVVGLDSVMVGLFLPEDNLHAPNESFSLNMMTRGMAMSAQALEEIADKGR